MIVFLVAICTWLAIHSACAAPRIIEFGWDTPHTKYVREHWREMEKMPFDGIVIKVYPADPARSGNKSLGWQTFQARRFEPDEYQHAIDDLREVKFTRFTDNFIQVVSQPGNVDWFDPQWSSISHNAAVMAKIARAGRCRGILFDPEQYGASPVWGYKALPEALKSAHSFEEYAAKARERGQEFIRAINAEFPDITILSLFGPSLTYLQATRQPLADTEYALLASFFDGICEAASPGTTVVDGFEFSYNYRIHEAFVQGKEYMLQKARSKSANEREFGQHMRAGFGIWADFNSGKLGWHPDDLTRNYFTPAGLRATLNYALRETQGYVWLYSERFNWWEGTAPKEFVEAVRLAKSGPGPGFIPKEQVAKAATLPGHSDEETFAALGPGLTELMDLPKTGWRFRRDPARSGEKAGWHTLPGPVEPPSRSGSSWLPTRIGQFWEEQGHDYDGTAWYRLTFKSPPRSPGKRVYLAFGAVDEIATVWLNGKLVGEHDKGDVGWNLPFMFDVSGVLRPGADNVLAVRVFDYFGGGGIWKSVKLLERKQ